MMKTRAALKSEVKQLFKGRWKDAVLLCIVVSLLSIFSIVTQYSEQSKNLNGGGTSDSVINQASSISGADIGIMLGVLAGFGLVQAIFALIIKLFNVGTSYSMLDWVRNPQREIHPVSDSTVAFTKRYAWPVIGLAILQFIYIILWSLLLVIPGIIKGYAYSQAFFVYKDLVAQTPAGAPAPRFRDALHQSEQLMRGHKWQYFVLQLSFIGWGIVSGLTFGIGQLWLVPYTYGTFANYYDNLTSLQRV